MEERGIDVVEHLDIGRRTENLDSGMHQEISSTAGLNAGISRTEDDTYDPSLHQRLGARRRLSMMTAGFQAHKGGRPPGGLQRAAHRSPGATLPPRLSRSGSTHTRPRDWESHPDFWADAPDPTPAPPGQRRAEATYGQIRRGPSNRESARHTDKRHPRAWLVRTRVSGQILVSPCPPSLQGELENQPGNGDAPEVNRTARG